MSQPHRVVKLREGEDGRHLTAYLDDFGHLHIDGEDFGPEIAAVTNRDSYEWFQSIAPDDVPRLVALLGGQDGEDILDLLDREYIGLRAGELERRLRESGIEVARHVI